MQGTIAQADAVRFLEHVGFQGLIMDCMVRQGFVYRPDPAFRVPSPTARFSRAVLDPVAPDVVDGDGLGLDATVAGLIEGAKAGRQIIFDASGMNGPQHPEYDVPGWDEALSGCEPSIEELDRWVAHPPYERSAPFADLVDRVLESDPVRGAAGTYPACMRAAGWPIEDRHELVDRVRGRYEALLVDVANSPSYDPVERAADVDQVVGSVEWSRVDDARADAASADAACRREAHDVALSALLEPLRAFKAEHRAEIEQLRTEWAVFEERADRTRDPAFR